MSKGHNSAFAQSHLFQNPQPVEPKTQSSQNAYFHRENELKSLLHFAVQNCETKTELQVFLCLMRFTVLEERTSCHASKSYIAKWTGLDAGNVKRGIAGLLSRKLISKANTDDLSEYEIHFPREGQYDPTSILSEVKLTPVERVVLTLPRSQIDPATKGAQIAQVAENLNEGGQNDSGAGGNVTPNRVSDLIYKYIHSLKGTSKFYPEKKALEKLQTMSTAEELEVCFQYLEQNGVVGDGKKCLMPLSYLVKSFDRVLELAGKKQEEKTRVLELQTLAETQRQREQEMRQVEEDRYTQAQVALEKAYPSEEGRLAVLAPIIQSKFKFSSGKSQLIRRLATVKWFETSGKVKG
ncbi:MAG: hypothetical protein R3A80_04370 [Bdellovibrionota bacterium]